VVGSPPTSLGVGEPSAQSCTVAKSNSRGAASSPAPFALAIVSARAAAATRASSRFRFSSRATLVSANASRAAGGGGGGTARFSSAARRFSSSHTDRSEGTSRTEVDPSRANVVSRGFRIASASTSTSSSTLDVRGGGGAVFASACVSDSEERRADGDGLALSSSCDASPGVSGNRRGRSATRVHRRGTVFRVHTRGGGGSVGSVPSRDESAFPSFPSTGLCVSLSFFSAEAADGVVAASPASLNKPKDSASSRAPKGKGPRGVGSTSSYSSSTGARRRRAPSPRAPRLAPSSSRTKPSSSSSIAALPSRNLRLVATRRACARGHRGRGSRKHASAHRATPAPVRFRSIIA
jgi:hypothetical protein